MMASKKINPLLLCGFVAMIGWLTSCSGSDSSSSSPVATHKPSLPKRVNSDAVATKKFGAYVGSLNDAAGGNLIRNYKITYCGLTLTVDADVWNRLSTQDQQNWMDKVIEDQTNVSPQCVSSTHAAIGVHQYLWDLAGNRIPDPYGDNE